MNKFLLSLIFVLFSALLFKLPAIYAQEEPTPSPTSSIVQYNLAFPGILPDSFLYKFKLVRDRIQLLLTSDPKAKISLLLKMADKGILASAILVDKKEWKLAGETALKAENNMTLLTPEISQLEDPIDQNLIKKLQTASLKHQEIFLKLKERVPGGNQDVFAQVTDFSKRNQAEIEKYLEQQ